METAPASADQPEKWQKRRRMMFAFLLVGGAAWGSLDLLLYDHGFLGRWISRAFTLLLGITVMMWCVYDSRIRGVPISTICRWFIVLLGIVGVPYYFWQSRSHRECCRGAFGLFLFAGIAVPYCAAWWLLKFVLQKVGYYA